MAGKFAVEKLIHAVQEGQEKEAMELMDQVNTELGKLHSLKNLGSNRREALKDLDEFITNVNGRQFKSARAKCERTRGNFNTHFKRLLENISPNDAATKQSSYPPKEPPVDYDQELDPYSGADVHKSGPEVHANKEYNTSSEKSRSVRKYNAQTQEDNSRFSEEQKSKRASQALRHNNPHMADLSDVNRPTKIAERFSELYDNDWTEAFDVLSNKKREDEKKIVHLLLNIVEEAYRFCKQESDEQIKKMHSAILDILKFGTSKGTEGISPVDSTLLVQYRKDHAVLAIGRLQEAFFARLKNICQTTVGEKEPSKNGTMAKYGNKAVELTWWMCVQDPPVYMYPTKGQPFKPDFYRPYTKSGNTVDFFVWPALRLSENDAILSKGVVQYK